MVEPFVCRQREINPNLASGATSQLIESLFQLTKYRSLHSSDQLIEERKLFLASMLDRVSARNASEYRQPPASGRTDPGT